MEYLVFEETNNYKECQKIQKGNVFFFLFTIIMNSFSEQLGNKNQIQISDEANISIMPAEFSFLICIIIYLLIGSFIIYQAKSIAQDRNNHMIFQQIRYKFMINMISNVLWMIIFQQGHPTAYFISLPFVYIMLYTSFTILHISQANQLNNFEKITIRGGFTIYTSWITTSFIINVLVFVKSTAIIQDQGFFMSHKAVSILTLTFITIFYIIICQHLNNTLFGLVYIWFLIGIYFKKNPTEDLSEATIVLSIIFAIYLFFQTFWNYRRGNQYGLFF